jgi:hypothetical protein
MAVLLKKICRRRQFFSTSDPCSNLPGHCPEYLPKLLTMVMTKGWTQTAISAWVGHIYQICPDGTVFLNSFGAFSFAGHLSENEENVEKNKDAE